ncbi:thiamine phosphate synthase [Staphylococcus gallinarum]|uniref:thiamine phosphate synthase n=1 Tax=Staphylococcus gallinarum TaxID=1293 RepID=UPI000E69BD74|nr:thiamine phosphate synthase [Staphylococcus gallinarum]MCD8870777.1 thiamine phosphate synthase [Staphylococcus gallinarum]MCW0985969.1 thiamine phosphate synthase [Staphylococcus gallinarum]RIO83334.1 thiamine phosphate synthase [Staphylococcus gallinarum]
MFVAITADKYLARKDIMHYLAIEAHIDYLIVRTPMSSDELVDWINMLLQYQFPKEKVIIHENIDVLNRCALTAIHFKEHNNQDLFFKQRFPHIQVSKSTHHSRMVAEAAQRGLDFVLFSHIFETKSKPGITPRTTDEINAALQYDIPVVALGGINHRTIAQLPNGFDGIAGISLFEKDNVAHLEQLKEVWHAYV